MNEEIQQIINDQIQAELQSAYDYLAMSAFFEEQSLEGFAHWMKKQWEEETEHAMKFYRHLLARNGHVELKSLKQPSVSFNSPLDVFRKALAQEQKITIFIHDMYERAVGDKDYALQQLLLWFIEEQVEEEDAARSIIDQLEMIGDSRSGLFLLDKELKQR
ncbi:MAG: ferritin [Balneolales bacterium]